MPRDDHVVTDPHTGIQMWRIWHTTNGRRLEPGTEFTTANGRRLEFRYAARVADWGNRIGIYCRTPGHDQHDPTIILNVTTIEKSVIHRTKRATR